MISAKQLNFFK